MSGEQSPPLPKTRRTRLLWKRSLVTAGIVTLSVTGLGLAYGLRRAREMADMWKIEAQVKTFLRTAETSPRSMAQAIEIARINSDFWQFYTFEEAVSVLAQRTRISDAEAEKRLGAWHRDPTRRETLATFERLPINLELGADILHVEEVIRHEAMAPVAAFIVARILRSGSGAIEISEMQKREIIESCHPHILPERGTFEFVHLFIKWDSSVSKVLVWFVASFVGVLMLCWSLTHPSNGWRRTAFTIGWIFAAAGGLWTWTEITRPSVFHMYDQEAVALFHLVTVGIVVGVLLALISTVVIAVGEVVQWHARTRMK